MGTGIELTELRRLAQRTETRQSTSMMHGNGFWSWHYISNGGDGEVLYCIVCWPLGRTYFTMGTSVKLKYSVYALATFYLTVLDAIR